MKKNEMKAVRGGEQGQKGACCCVCWGSSFPTASYSIGGHSNSAT